MRAPAVLLTISEHAPCPPARARVQNAFHPKRPLPQVNLLTACLTVSRRHRAHATHTLRRRLPRGLKAGSYVVCRHASRCLGRLVCVGGAGALRSARGERPPTQKGPPRADHAPGRPHRQQTNINMTGVVWWDWQARRSPPRGAARRRARATPRVALCAARATDEGALVVNQKSGRERARCTVHAEGGGRGERGGAKRCAAGAAGGPPSPPPRAKRGGGRAPRASPATQQPAPSGAGEGRTGRRRGGTARTVPRTSAPSGGERDRQRVRWGVRGSRRVLWWAGVRARTRRVEDAPSQRDQEPRAALSARAARTGSGVAARRRHVQRTGGWVWGEGGQVLVDQHRWLGGRGALRRRLKPHVPERWLGCARARVAHVSREQACRYAGVCVCVVRARASDQPPGGAARRSRTEACKLRGEVK